MKNSSDFAKDIITSSERQEISPSDNFVPYLVQKYLSGASPELCNLINSIINTKIGDWRDNQQIYDFLKCVVPKKKIPYFKYYGKSSSKKETKVDVEAIAGALEIPPHELLEMFEYFPELEKSMLEDKEKILKRKN